MIRKNYFFLINWNFTLVQKNWYCWSQVSLLAIEVAWSLDFGSNWNLIGSGEREERIHMQEGGLQASLLFFLLLYGMPAPSAECQHPEARPASIYGHLRESADCLCKCCLHMNRLINSLLKLMLPEPRNLRKFSKFAQFVLRCCWFWLVFIIFLCLLNRYWQIFLSPTIGQEILAVNVLRVPNNS